MSVTNITDAKTKLSKLIAAAERGEEVVIARAGRPVVRMVCLKAEPVAGAGRRAMFGAWKHLAPTPTLEEWKAMDREIEEMFEQSEIFPE